MEKDIDYKWVLFEIISGIKAKPEYLKTINSSDEKFNLDYFNGMAFAYHNVLDEIISILDNFDVDLSQFSLDGFEVNEILNYKPKNIK